MKLRRVVSDIFFAWWDGIFSFLSIALSISSAGADYALERMQSVARRTVAETCGLVPEALACLKDVDDQRAEAHEVIRKAVHRLYELDGVAVRIKQVGRKQ